jgi:uncharacterized delta-60 repeat protein
MMWVLMRPARVFISICLLLCVGLSRLLYAGPAPGDVDPGFEPGPGQVNGMVRIIVAQPDAKILIGGDFSTVRGARRNRIARLNTDGTVDRSFKGVDFSFIPTASGIAGSIFSLALQSDRKVVMGGNFTSVNGVTRNFIARLNADGTLDSAFDAGMSASLGSLGLFSMALQSDGKILIGGYFGSFGTTIRRIIARLNTDGRLDTGFDASPGPNEEVYSVFALPDGKVLVGGRFTSFNQNGRNYIARLNPNGKLDLTFHGQVKMDVRSIAMQSDGKVVLGGFPGGLTAGTCLVRLVPDGLDPGFETDLAEGRQVQSVAAQNDDKLLVAGNFAVFRGASRNGIARLNRDGSLDEDFDPGTGADARVVCVTTQMDGKVLIGGAFHSFDGTARNYIARLNANGTLDPTFDPGGGPNNVIKSLSLQTNGKVVIAGSFSYVNNSNRTSIARLNADGKLDNSFDPGGGANGAVNCTVLQPDSKVVAAGSFTTMNGLR